MAREWWPFLDKITYEITGGPISVLCLRKHAQQEEKKLKQYIGTLKYNFTIISAQKTHFDANIARK